MLAARDAESSIGDLASFSSFDGKSKRLLIERVAPALRRLRRAADQPCDFRFQSYPHDVPNPNHAGWRLIRQSLVWQIEAAIRAKNYDTAVNLASLATRVGFDLCNGGASDADVGMQFVDEARRSIVSSIPDFSASQLSALTRGYKSALDRLPPFSSISEHEAENFKQGVQWIQDRYRANEFASIDSFLGSTVRDATSYLKGLKSEDREKRPAYFEGFAQESETVAEWWGAQSSLAVLKRRSEKEMKLAKERPWRRYSAALFGTLKPIQARYDATLARTRLLILSSEVYRQIKVSGTAPKTLKAFSPELVRDPYMGTSFRYQPLGADFKLYSFGPNYWDDQGATDSLFTSPDLTLESNRR